MNLSIAVPDDVAHRLENSWDDIAKHTLESLALEAYESGVLTEADLLNDIEAIRKLKRG